VPIAEWQGLNIETLRRSGYKPRGTAVSRSLWFNKNRCILLFFFFSSEKSYANLGKCPTI